VEVETLEIISREISIIGNLVGSSTDLRELMALTQRGQVTLSTRTCPLAGALDALSDLEKGRLPGTRAILVPARPRRWALTPGFGARNRASAHSVRLPVRSG
jgi:NAD+-dependent secondary alcohol dehydrogenase Adh1